MSKHVILEARFDVPNAIFQVLWPTCSHNSLIRDMGTIHSAINNLCKKIAYEQRDPGEKEQKAFDWANKLSDVPGVAFRDVPRAYWCWKCGVRYTTNTPSFGFICRTGTGCRANDTGLIGIIVPPPAELVSKPKPKLRLDPYLAHAFKDDGKPLTNCGRNPRHDICIADTLNGTLTSNSEHWTGFKLRPYGDSPSVGYDDQTGDDICADVLPEGIVRRKV